MARLLPGRLLGVGLLLTLAASLTAQTSAFLQPGPLTMGLWHMDEGQGNRAFDAGSARLEGFLLQGASWAPSPWGGGVRIAAAGQELSIPDPRGTLELANPFTLEAWVRLENLASPSVPVLSRQAAAGGAAYELRFMSFPAGWAFKYLDASGAPNVLFGRASLQAGTWHHVAVTWDGKTARIFQNTLELSNQPVEGFLGADHTQPWRVGPGEHGAHFLGTIDELHLAAQALPWSFFRAGQTGYGLGKPGSLAVVPSLRQSGGPPAALAANLVLELDRGHPKMPGLLFLSPTPALLPVQGGSILVAPQGMVSLPVLFDDGIAGIPGTGRARVVLPPTSPTFIGHVICCQALLADPGAFGGFSLTPGLALWFPY